MVRKRKASENDANSTTNNESDNYQDKTRKRTRIAAKNINTIVSDGPGGEGSPANQAGAQTRVSKSTRGRGRPRAQTIQRAQPSGNATPKPTKRKQPTKKKLQDDRAEANKKVRALEMKYQALKEENDTLNSKLRNFQERRLDSNRQDKDYLQDDQTINTNIRQAIKPLSDLAASLAKKGYIMDGLHEEQANKVLAILKSDVGKSSSSKLLNSSNGRLLFHSGGSRLALEAHLLDIILENTLSQPFHFLPRQESTDKTPSFNVMLDLYNRMSDDSPDKKLWLALTLRLLYPSAQKYSGSPAEAIHEDEFQRSRDRFNDNLIDHIFHKSGPLQLLLKPEIDDSRIEQVKKELHRILLTFQKLTLQLMVQNLDIKVIWDEQEVMESGFKVQDDLVEPHSMMQIDTSDTSLDGRNVDFVVRPLIRITRYETEDGQPKSFIASKTQVIVFQESKWKSNKLNYEENKLTQEKGTSLDLPNQYPKKCRNYVSDVSRIEVKKEKEELVADQPRSDQMQQFSDHDDVKYDQSHAEIQKIDAHRSIDQRRSCKAECQDDGRPFSESENTPEIIDLISPELSAQEISEENNIPDLSPMGLHSDAALLWGIKSAATTVLPISTTCDSADVKTYRSTQTQTCDKQDDFKEARCISGRDVKERSFIDGGNNEIS